MVDPFWRIKASTYQPSKVRAWAAHATDVSYVTPSGASYVGPLNSPPDDWGEGQPDLADITYVQVLPSRRDQNRCFLLAEWQNGSGDYRSAFAITLSHANTWSWFSVDNAGGNDCRGIWMAENLGTSDHLWLTAWVNGNLKIYAYNAETGALVNDYTLGAATIGEIADKTYWVFPYCYWVYDAAEVYVAGRMAGIPGDANLKHVVRFDGTTWYTVVDSWGDYHCGALAVAVEEGNEMLYAVRQKFA
jgi:hypothetical protein